MVEHRIVLPVAAGSSPVAHPNPSTRRIVLVGIATVFSLFMSGPARAQRVVERTVGLSSVVVGGDLPEAARQMLTARLVEGLSASRFNVKQGGAEVGRT